MKSNNDKSIKKFQLRLTSFKYNIKVKNKDTPIKFYDTFCSLKCVNKKNTFELIEPRDKNLHSFYCKDQNIEDDLFYFNYDNKSLRIYYSQWMRNSNWIIELQCDCNIDDEETLFLVEKFISFIDSCEFKKHFHIKLINSDLSKYYLSQLYPMVLDFETSFRELLWILLLYNYSKNEIKEILTRLNMYNEKTKSVKSSKAEEIYDFLEELVFSEYSNLLCTRFLLDGEFEKEIGKIDFAQEKDIIISQLTKLYQGKSLIERLDSTMFHNGNNTLFNLLDEIKRVRNTIMHCKHITK